MFVLSTFPRFRMISMLLPRNAAASRGVCRRRTLRATLAHRSRSGARVLAPRRPAAAWPHCHRDKWDRPAAWGRVRGPHRAAAVAPPRDPPPPPRAPWPAPSAPPHAAPCVAEQSKPPLPLTSGARWSGGLRG
ncbi:hypothetical protein PVAP13_8NG309068 [Panicum virgatum]|uniref:Uncharacterized protein n=1 Tax=Panicum virgatum TaxID=38727 RepID=A0A8T0PAM8_PANVG|nr:hypothetical protein PVAP13_8NG309068 [Panicum virgatum]